MADHNRRGGTGNTLHVVMFGHPHTFKAPALGVGRHIPGIVQSRAWVCVFGDAYQFKNRKFGHFGLLPIAECLMAECLVAERSVAESSEEHTSELQSRGHLVCRLLLEKTNDNTINN